jgi:hypothetical protein
MKLTPAMGLYFPPIPDKYHFSSLKNLCSTINPNEDHECFLLEQYGFDDPQLHTTGNIVMIPYGAYCDDLWMECLLCGP